MWILYPENFFLAKTPNKISIWRGKSARERDMERWWLCNQKKNYIFFSVCVHQIWQFDYEKNNNNLKHRLEKQIVVVVVFPSTIFNLNNHQFLMKILCNIFCLFDGGGGDGGGQFISEFFGVNSVWWISFENDFSHLFWNLVNYLTVKKTTETTTNNNNIKSIFLVTKIFLPPKKSFCLFLSHLKWLV